MNVKKLISSVSALALAASAFAGLAVTANAETLYSQDYESGTVDWTTGTSGRFTPVILEEDGNKYLSVDQDTRNNNGTTISSTAVSVASGTDYTLIFDMKIGSSTNQTPAAFNIYDSANSGKILSFTAAGTWTDNWIVNDGDTIQLSKSGGGKAIADLGWYTVTLTRKGDKEYLTIIDKAEETAVLEKKSVSGSETGGIGKFEFVTRRYNANFAIDNVLVRDVEESDLPSTPQGSFKVQYVTTDDVTLEKTSGGSADAGTSPSLTAADKADFIENGQKYIYVSDDAADVTLDADNEVTVTVTVRAAAKYDITVNSKVGEETAPLTSISVFEGDSGSYSYPMYLTDENAKVTAKADDSTYTKTVTPTESATEEIVYTAYEGTAYFVDHELITNTAKLGSGNYSNGSASRAVNDGVAAFTVAEAGTYDITVAASCRNTGNSSVFAVYKNAVSDENLIFNDDVKGTSQNNIQTNGIKTKTDVELAENDVIIIQGDNGNTWVDYVLAVQTATAEPEAPSYTVTFVNSKAGTSEDKIANEDNEYKVTAPEGDAVEGSIFEGWFTADGDEFDPSAAVSEDITYYAVYTDIVEPTINVEKIGVFTEDEGNPAVAFKGDVTAGTYAISTLRWLAYTSAEDMTNVDVSVNIASGSNVVVGLVVEAANVDVNSINVGLDPFDAEIMFR